MEGWKALVLLLSTGFGLGWLPWAAGSFGSSLGIPLAWWLVGRPLAIQVGIIALLLAFAVLLCHEASEWFGSGDVSQIVADELVAFPIAVLGLAAARTPWIMGSAFALYRLFEINKLPPGAGFEHLGGGLGIVLDDVTAALYGWLVLAVGIALWRRGQGD